MNVQIEIISQPLDDLLGQLMKRTGEAQPFLQALGEDMVERIKGRFVTATAPDGTAWAPNSAATLARYIQSRGKTASKKKSAAGKKAPPSKRPLTDHGDLSMGIHYQAGDDGLLIASPAPQAFMMQFGGTKSQFPNLWGDIPARAFFPMRPDGSLYQAEEDEIVSSLAYYLSVQ